MCQLVFQPGLGGRERIRVARLEDDLDGAAIRAEARVRADAHLGMTRARRLEHRDDAALGGAVRVSPGADRGAPAISAATSSNIDSLPPARRGSTRTVA